LIGAEAWNSSFVLSRNFIYKEDIFDIADYQSPKKSCLLLKGQNQTIGRPELWKAKRSKEDNGVSLCDKLRILTERV
jgi:hypothetical protein